MILKKQALWLKLLAADNVDIEVWTDGEILLLFIPNSCTADKINPVLKWTDIKWNGTNNTESSRLIKAKVSAFRLCSRIEYRSCKKQLVGMYMVHWFPFKICNDVLQYVYQALLCLAILWLGVYTVAVLWLGKSWLKMGSKKIRKKNANRFSIQFYCYTRGSVPCSIQDVNLFVSKCGHAYFYQAEIVV